MAKLITTAPRGTQDVLPQESYKWHFIEGKLMDLARRYGFSEVRTPTFEHTGLFDRGVGDTTDIVQKEMYTCRLYTSLPRTPWTVWPRGPARCWKIWICSKKCGPTTATAATDRARPL